MDIRIGTQPQMGATYDDILGAAQAAERLGFDGFFVSDHVMGWRDPMESLPGPTDAWTTLAGLARETSTIRLGTLVTSANFRYPGLLAVQVAQVDQMSGGRIDFGLGAGWSEAEHRAYGLPFPVRRFDVLEEQLDVITGIWSTPLGERFSYDGEFYQLTECPAVPKPTQSNPPIIIGGKGPTRTPAVAARYADEFNGSYATLEETPRMFAAARVACEAIDRDPSTLVYSVMSSLGVGATAADRQRRAGYSGKSVDDLVETGVGGTPQQAIDRLAALAEAGVQRIYLQFPGFTDIDHLELIAAEVLPAARAL